MSLAKQIEKDFLAAYKARESERVAVLRMLKTAIKNAAVELRRDPDDDEVLAIVQRQVKQRREAAEQFRAGGRDEMAAQEEREERLLTEYLPAQLSPEELAAAVDAIVAEVGAASPKDMGKVMQGLAARYKGRYDGRAASELVRSRLA